MGYQKTITLGNSSWASNPAGAKISMLRYAWYYPTWPVVWAVGLAGGVLLVFELSVWFVLLLVVTLACTVFFWIRTKEFFTHGDANHGVVVQVNPTLVAVAVDLRKGVGSYPAIKVFRTRLRRSMGQRVALGMRLPTVALYQGSPDSKSPHWADFDPRPLECVTTKREVLERVMASCDGEENRRREAGIALLPNVEPGLYIFTEGGWKRVPGFSAMAFFWSTLATNLRTRQSPDVPRLAAKHKW